MPDSPVVLRLFLPELTSAALGRLKRALPDLVLTPLGLEIPLDNRAPEELLSLFLRHGVTARATRITRSGSIRLTALGSGPKFPPEITPDPN